MLAALGKFYAVLSFLEVPNFICEFAGIVVSYLYFIFNRINKELLEDQPTKESRPFFQSGKQNRRYIPP
jgi:hypothetical protein